MHDPIPVTGTQHGKVVNMACEMGKEVGNFDTALPAPGETSRGAEEPGIGLDGLITSLAKLRRPRLPVQAIQEGLGIEGFQVTRAAGHEKEDNRPGFRIGQVRRPRSQRIGLSRT